MAQSDNGKYQIDDETKKKLAEENAERGPKPENSKDEASNKEKAQDSEKKAPEKDAPKKDAPNDAPNDAPETDYGKYIPKFVDIGEKPREFFKRLAWRRRLMRERRKLRKELKKQGITKWRDFDEIAREVGLGLDNRRGLLAWLWWKWLGIMQLLGLKGVLVAAGMLALALFAASYLTDFKGSFTINLTADLINNGFILSEKADLSDPKSRLVSDAVTVNNITLSDIAADVDMIDGRHNGNSYLAITFYLSNAGTNTNNVQYMLKMKGSLFDVDEAVWIMLFTDGKQVVYAQPNSLGNQEKLFGYPEEPPFYDSAYDAEIQYYQKENEDGWGIATTKFEADDIVVQGVLLDVEPGETHKYTIVIWLEGWDPECTNELLGGYSKYEMLFDVITADDAERGIFDGIFRTDYDDYMNGKKKDSEIHSDN